MTNEKLSIWLGFLKFLLGTVVFGIATMMINHEFQEREIALKEMDQLGKFVEHALIEDVGVRLRFAQYFASLTRSAALKTGWEEYVAIVKEEYGQTQAEIAQLEKEKEAEKIDEERKKELEARINQLESQLEVPKSFRAQKSGLKFDSSFKYELNEDTEFMTSITPESEISTQYIDLDKDGKLTIRRGYKWNGVGGPIKDTIEIFRAGLAHTALYALMRWEKLSSKQYRKQADALFKKLCIEDGVSRLRASVYYKALRKFGAPEASPAMAKKGSGAF